MAKGKRPKGILGKQLEQILADEEATHYEIEASAKVPRGALARFLSGERGLTLATLDKLAGPLGLRLVQVEKRAGRRRRRVVAAGGP